jgi:hypothetical protein
LTALPQFFSCALLDYLIAFWVATREVATDAPAAE